MWIYSLVPPTFQKHKKFFIAIGTVRSKYADANFSHGKSPSLVFARILLIHLYSLLPIHRSRSLLLFDLNRAFYQGMHEVDLRKVLQQFFRFGPQLRNTLLFRWRKLGLPSFDFLFGKINSSSNPAPNDISARAAAKPPSEISWMARIFLYWFPCWQK